MNDERKEMQAELDLHRWIPVSERLPEDLKRVEVVILTSGKKQWFTIAEHVGKRTVLAKDYIDEDCYDFHDYDDDADIYYAPSGWYEANIEPEINYHLSAEVTHWKPIILPKENQ